MKLKYSDNGTDLAKGDIVFIKFEVIENPTSVGSVRLRFYPRNGFDEYAADSIGAVFIKRPKSRLLKEFINWICK